MEGEWLLNGIECPATKTYIFDMFSMAWVQIKMP